MTKDEAIEVLKGTKEYMEQIENDWTRERTKEVVKMSIEALFERPTGEWIFDPNGYDYGLPAWKCDQCGCINANIPPSIVTRDGKPSYAPMTPKSFNGSNFCPNCGAEMV